MATITTRAGKGSPLTNTEVDDNFSNLNSAKYESGSNVSFGTLSSGVQTIQGNFESDYAIKFDNTKGTGAEWGWRSHGVNGERFSFYDVSSGAQYMAFSNSSVEGVIFNENSLDQDFRVESNDNANMLFVDASTNRVGVGVVPDVPLHVYKNSGLNTTVELLRLDCGDNVHQGGKGGKIRFTDISIYTSTAEIIARREGVTGSSHLEFSLRDTVRLGLFSDGSFTTTPAAGGHAVFNEGSVDADFRVESNDNANMLFVDGGSNKVGIGRDPQDNGSTLQVAADATVSTDLQLALRGLSNENKKLLLGFDTTTDIASITSFEAGVAHRPLHLQGSEFVWNEGGSNHDFRVESDGNVNMLFVDASTNRIGIGNSDPGSQLDVGDTTYHDGTLTVNGSIALNSSSNLNPSLNRWAMRVRAAGNEGHLDFYDGRNAAARVTFDDGGKVGIGKSPASYDGMLTVENPNATRSYVDRVRTEWNSIFNVSEATHHQRFKLTVDNIRRSSLVKITCQPRSSAGISSMNGCTMELSIYRADGGAGFSLTSINNGGHGGGSIRFAKPVASGNDVIFSIITSNNGTGTTYQVATKVEVIGNTDNNIIYSEIAGSTSGGGSDPGTGHFFYANGVELAGLEYNETTFNEDSNNKDFRVESNDNANMLFVDGGSNRVGIGASPSSTLTVSNPADSDGGSIADFVGHDNNQRLIVANFSCGSDEDRVGLIWENQGSVLLRQWMASTGQLYVSGSNPANQTDGDRLIKDQANIGGTGDRGISIPNGDRFGFDETGTRSWTMKATAGNLTINSGDGNGQTDVNMNLYTAGDLTVNGAHHKKGAYQSTYGATYIGSEYLARGLSGVLLHTYADYYASWNTSTETIGIFEVSHDSVNWADKYIMVEVFHTMYNGGGYARYYWNSQYNSNSLIEIEKNGNNSHVTAAVSGLTTVTGNHKKATFNLTFGYYQHATVRVTSNMTASTTITGPNQLRFLQ